VEGVGDREENSGTMSQTHSTQCLRTRRDVGRVRDRPGGSDDSVPMRGKRRERGERRVRRERRERRTSQAKRKTKTKFSPQKQSIQD
jgi:hypothetical protein